MSNRQEIEKEIRENIRFIYRNGYIEDLIDRQGRKVIADHYFNGQLMYVLNNPENRGTYKFGSWEIEDEMPSEAEIGKQLDGMQEEMIRLLVEQQIKK